MLTGKIDISKTKSFQQLRLENKEHKLKIQLKIYNLKTFTSTHTIIVCVDKNKILELF